MSQSKLSLPMRIAGRARMASTFSSFVLFGTLVLSTAIAHDHLSGQDISKSPSAKQVEGVSEITKENLALNTIFQQANPNEIVEIEVEGTMYPVGVKYVDDGTVLVISEENVADLVKIKNVYRAMNESDHEQSKLSIEVVENT